MNNLNFDKNENIETYHRKLNKWLEKKIMRNPDQWIWTHNRWKRLIILIFLFLIELQ